MPCGDQVELYLGGADRHSGGHRQAKIGIREGSVLQALGAQDLQRQRADRRIGRGTGNASDLGIGRGPVSLERDLLELDERMEQAVAGKAADRPLMGSHPVYQYLARRYGLDLRAVHFEPDASPADEAWNDLQRVLEEHPAKWMLWEGAPIDETAEKLKAMGLESVVFDPSGNRPAAGDYLSVMASNVSGLESVFSAP